MTEQVRVVVIGGGAVGASCLYHLALMGLNDALLIEQNELTSGSTWHAAGNVPTYSSSLTLLKLQNYSAALYRELGARVDYPINYHVVGALRLAHTDERMAEFRHIAAMAALNGMAFDVLRPEQIPEKHPYVALDDLKGALWDPYDGDIDPAQLTQALAKGARDLGARVKRFTRVIGLEQLASGAWKVTTDSGDIVAGVVVNAAGYRAGEVMALLGRHLPIISMQHQYLVTEDVPELTGRTERLPLMRDPDASYYMRQERGGFILGPYEWDARPMWLDGLPADFSFQLWNDDLDRIAPVVESIMERVPILANAGIRKVVNGPIPYSPDGNPYIGPEHGLTNFFHCNTFSFGIAQAGGAGKCLAEWVVEGRSEWDLWSLDRRRYTTYADPAFTVARAVEIYQNEYAPAFPYEERPAGRPQRTSPTYPLLKERGAVFGMRGGWERAVYFDPQGIAPVPSLTFARRRNWFDLVGREVEAVRSAAGLIELAGLSRFEVTGSGAAAFLDRILASPLPAVGRAGLAYALDAKGGILSEFLVVRRAKDAFLLTAAASAEWHDEDVLRHALPADGSVTLRATNAETTLLALAGPKTREILVRLTNADLSNDGFPWLGAQTILVAGIEVLAVRTSYTGELGWELHVRNADAVALYQALLEAGQASGLAEFGLYALESLRLDKGYRSWKADIETGFTPFEASIGWAVDLGKPDFTGKSALLAEGARQPGILLVPFLLDVAGESDAPACAPVLVDGERVGMVTSGGWSYTLGRSIGLASVPRPVAAPGMAIEIEIHGERRTAVIGAEPLFDPDNRRPQAEG